MGGSPAELKAIADHVVPSADEDGLAVAIEEFVLPRL
jgi:hydroxymethylpyrimidine pyrophosphatase-like HAD family hydrolase